MSSINQLLKRKTKVKRINYPQKKGWVLKVRTSSPRKPNSAVRKIVKVQLSNNQQTVVYVPGEGHNLRRHSHVLVRHGGARDTPGVYYSCLRGKYDLAPWLSKTNKRSKYGVKKKT